MALRTDLTLYPDGDLPIDAPGLMPVGFSDQQHVTDCMNSFPGEWKQYPTNGVGVARYLKASNNVAGTIQRESRIQLQRDGYGVGNMLVGTNAAGKLIVAPNAYRV